VAVIDKQRGHRYLVQRPRSTTHRRPRGHPSGDEAARPDRRAMGCARPAAACHVGPRSAAEMDQTSAHRRDPLADPDRRTLARRAGRVSALASHLRPVPPLAARRHLGHHPRRPSNRGGGPGPHRVRRQHRLDDQPRLPAHPRRLPVTGHLQKEPPGGVHEEPVYHARSAARGRSRRPPRSRRVARRFGEAFVNLTAAGVVTQSRYLRSPRWGRRHRRCCRCGVQIVAGSAAAG
jgi:hypothetical protein